MKNGLSMGKDMVCGFGETCPMSALPWVFGDDTKVADALGAPVEGFQEMIKQMTDT